MRDSVRCSSLLAATASRRFSFLGRWQSMHIKITARKRGWLNATAILIVPIHRALCILAVFHAYLVYLFTHIWSTNVGFPRIFGLHLRINGLPDACIIMILKRMHFPLYTCMYYLYGPPVVAARLVEIARAHAASDLRPPHGGKGASGAQRTILGICGVEGRSSTPSSSTSRRSAE